MASLRGYVFDHLGLKLVALLLAVLVYLNVYTEREAHLALSFPLRLTGLADSLAVSGEIPDAIRADLAGTGKHLLRMRFLEPSVELSLKEAREGHILRQLGPEDLPLPPQAGIRVERFIGPAQVELRVEPRVERRLPVHVAVAGEPGRGLVWTGAFVAQPESVTVSGPRSGVLRMTSVDFGAVRVQGKRDTVRSEQPVTPLGRSYRVSPEHVRVRVPLEPTETRRVPAPVRVREGGGFRVEPETVRVELTAPRGFWQRAELRTPVGYVSAADTAPGGRVRVRLDPAWQRLGAARVIPESVQVRRESVPAAPRSPKARGPVR